jgi:hypothetical protein
MQMELRRRVIPPTHLSLFLLKNSYAKLSAYSAQINERKLFFYETKKALKE